ncbi:hypothetical protein [Virgibacillus sp. CBA3643]|uniref:hypothetical protein n=1 Tax=Virgibacillus sp. CBA3643 TaxID=2942278 RepID=UPI0035A2A20C
MTTAEKPKKPIERNKERAKGGKKKDRMAGGGLVYVLQKYDNAFSEGLLDEIAGWFNEGYELEDISEEIKRPATEILMALIHLADQEKIEKAFAYRKRNEAV